MKFPGILFFLLAAVQLAVAQEIIPMTLSLAEAREIARENNLLFLQKSKEAAISKLKIDQARLRRIPSIGGQLTGQRNLIIPVTPVPAKAFDPSAAEGEMTYLRFTTPWTSKAGVQASYDLINPVSKGEVREAEIQASLADIERSLSENDLLFEVGQAYASTVIAKKQLQLAEKDTLTRGIIEKMSHEQYDAGRLTKVEYHQVLSDLNNTLSHYEEASMIYINSRLQLFNLLGFDPGESQGIHLSDSIENLVQLAAYFSDPYVQKESLSLEQAEQQEKLTESQLATLRAGFFPTLTLNGFYGANYFGNNLHLLNGKQWYGNGFISLELHLPLTEGLEKNKVYRQLQLQREVNQLDYKAQSNQNTLGFLEAQRSRSFNQKKYLLKKENLDLAQENLAVAKEQYENGRLLIGELYQEIGVYEGEKNSYLEAAYDLLIAQMTLTKTASR